MNRAFVLLASLAALSGCNAQLGGPPLLAGGKSPPAAQSRNSEPEPPGSLPAGFQGIGHSGPNSFAPNYAAITFPTPF